MIKKCCTLHKLAEGAVAGTSEYRLREAEVLSHDCRRRGAIRSVYAWAEKQSDDGASLPRKCRYWGFVMHRKQLFLLLGCIMSSSVGEELARRGERAMRMLTWASRPGRSSAARRRTSGWRSRRPSRRRSPRSPCSTCRWPAGGDERGGGQGGKERAEGGEEGGGGKERGREINGGRVINGPQKQRVMKWKGQIQNTGGGWLGWGRGTGVVVVVVWAWEAQIFNKLSKVCSN